MPTQSECPTATSLILEFKDAIAEHYRANRESGTMAVSKDPKVITLSGEAIGSIKFDRTLNSIVVIYH